MCLQTSRVRTLSQLLVDKLDRGLCEPGWTVTTEGRLCVCFFFPLSGRQKNLRSIKMLQLKPGLALLSSGYMRLACLKKKQNKRLFLFGSFSKTAQPVCWWCSVFSLSVFTTLIFHVNIYLRELIFLIWSTGAWGKHLNMSLRNSVLSVSLNIHKMFALPHYNFPSIIETY